MYYTGTQQAEETDETGLDEYVMPVVVPSPRAPGVTRSVALGAPTFGAPTDSDREHPLGSDADDTHDHDENRRAPSVLDVIRGTVRKLVGRDEGK